MSFIAPKGWLARSSGSAWESAVLALSPLHWYKLDEASASGAGSVIDSGSAALHVEPFNTPTFAQSPVLPLGLGTSVAFAAGSSERISVLETAITAYPISIGCWVQLTDALTSSYCAVSIGDNAGDAYIWLGTVTGSGGRFFLRTRGSSVNASVTGTTESSTTGAKVFLSCTIEAGTQTLFVNGVSEGTPNTPRAFPGGTRILHIGALASNPPSTFWPNLIDEVVIFNQALTAGQWLALYQAGGGV